MLPVVPLLSTQTLTGKHWLFLNSQNSKKMQNNKNTIVEGRMEDCLSQISSVKYRRNKYHVQRMLVIF